MTFLVSGALSLTVITLNRIIGIVMPRFANLLKLNRLSVYSILAVVWTLSFAAAAPCFYFRKYYVSRVLNYLYNIPENTTK